MMKLLSYREMSRLKSFEERYNYLKLSGIVGISTFGADRYINQKFYKSTEWKRIRDLVIIRDDSCDLAIPGREIFGNLVIHHLNPVNLDDLENNFELVTDLNNLITTTHITHMAIHYGDEKILQRSFQERRPGDTTLWQKINR